MDRIPNSARSTSSDGRSTIKRKNASLERNKGTIEAGQATIKDLSLEEKAKIGELAKKHAEVTHEKRLLEDEKKVLESELEAERMVAKKNKSDAKKFKSKYKELKAELEKTLDTVELLKKERDILKMRPETRDAEVMTDPVSVQSSTDKENMPPEPPTLRSSLFSPGEKSRPADISAAQITHVPPRPKAAMNASCQTQVQIDEEEIPRQLEALSQSYIGSDNGDVPFIETPDLALPGITTERLEDRRTLHDAIDLKSEILRLSKSLQKLSAPNQHLRSMNQSISPTLKSQDDPIFNPLKTASFFKESVGSANPLLFESLDKGASLRLNNPKSSTDRMNHVLERAAINSKKMQLLMEGDTSISTIRSNPIISPTSQNVTQGPMFRSPTPTAQLPTQPTDELDVEINDEYYDNNLFDLVDDLEGVGPTTAPTHLTGDYSSSAATSEAWKSHKPSMPNILEVIEGIESDYSSLYSEDSFTYK